MATSQLCNFPKVRLGLYNGGPSAAVRTGFRSSVVTRTDLENWAVGKLPLGKILLGSCCLKKKSPGKSETPIN